MRWGDMRESENVEDRSGPGGDMRLGGGALILIVIVSLIFGINPLEMLGVMGGSGPIQQAPTQSAPPGYGPQQRAPAPATPEKQLSKRVLGDTEDVWTALFKAMGTRYEPPTLVLFTGRVNSA